MPQVDDYVVLGSVGSGTYGACKKIKRKRDRKILVWKEINYKNMSEMEKQMIISEVNVLRELRHKNIVRYHDRVVDKANSTLYIVMEFCENGDLASIIKKTKKSGRFLDERYIWRMCHQITLALHECHGRSRKEKSVLHRDLKPANIFLDGEHNVKVGDFGLARVLNHDASFAKTFVGTPYYMSPEQMVHEQYDESSDIWSLGCVLYELAALCPPFTGYSHHDLAKAICMGQYGNIPDFYSQELKSLITKLLSVNTDRRPTTEEILSITSQKDTSTDDEELETLRASLKKQQQAATKKEESLKKKERELKQWEKELRQREGALKLQEKMFAAKLARAEKSSQKESSEKENQSPALPSSRANKESNDINNILISALRRGAKSMRKSKKESYQERIGHLASDHQDWTKLDLVKEMCRHLRQQSGNNPEPEILSRLSKVHARCTEMQRLNLVSKQHNSHLAEVML